MTAWRPSLNYQICAAACLFVQPKFQEVAISGIAITRRRNNNDSIQQVLTRDGEIMQKASSAVRVTAIQLNRDKVHAAAAMLSSAAVSIGAIYWLIRSFF